MKQKVSENLQRVREQISQAAHDAGRAAESVRLIGVTKYVSAEWTRWLCDAGCLDLGESRPQTIWQKGPELADCQPHWHLIGSLQRNKLARTMPWVEWIHSIDRPVLIDELAAWADSQQRTVQGLLEVNISGEASKHGFAPSEVEHALERALNYPRLQIRGLMGMAAGEGGPTRARREFATLRALRDRCASQLPAGHALPELSMGMSGDFVEAIAEGATMVRIGSALWEGLPAS